LPIQVATVLGATRCTPDTATISATALAGLTIDWYADTTASPVQSGTVTGVNKYTINTPMSVTTTFYAQARNLTTGCVSALFKPVVVVVNPRPDAPAATGAARCGTGTVGLSASGTGTIKWYNASTTGTLLSSGNSYTTTSISTTTVYYALDSINATGCVSATRTAVTATVNAVPSAPTGTSAARCGTGTVDLSATGTGTIKWYNASTGGTLFCKPINIQ
jgi:hypothetical protein